MTQRIPVIENILDADDRLAEENRACIEAAGVFSIDSMASSGAGGGFDERMDRLPRSVIHKP